MSSWFDQRTWQPEHLASLCGVAKTSLQAWQGHQGIDMGEGFFIKKKKSVIHREVGLDFFASMVHGCDDPRALARQLAEGQEQWWPIKDLATLFDASTKVVGSVWLDRPNLGLTFLRGPAGLKNQVKKVLRSSAIGLLGKQLPPGWEAELWADRLLSGTEGYVNGAYLAGKVNLGPRTLLEIPRTDLPYVLRPISEERLYFRSFALDWLGAQRPA